MSNFQTLMERTKNLGPEVFWHDGETNHGVLFERFKEVGVEPREAAVMATIQSGFWPDWLVVDYILEEPLEDHCLAVRERPNFGTTLFGGWFSENWDDLEAAEKAAAEAYNSGDRDDLARAEDEIFRLRGRPRKP